MGSAGLVGPWRRQHDALLPVAVTWQCGVGQLAGCLVDVVFVAHDWALAPATHHTRRTDLQLDFALAHLRSDRGHQLVIHGLVHLVAGRCTHGGGLPHGAALFGLRLDVWLESFFGWAVARVGLAGQPNPGFDLVGT